MLGFAPLSEIPFATYEIDLSTSAFFSGVSADVSADVVAIEGMANSVLAPTYIPSSVSNILYVAKAILAIDSVRTEPVENNVIARGGARAIYPSFSITGSVSF
jgi:hypothetical protein